MTTSSPNFPVGTNTYSTAGATPSSTIINAVRATRSPTSSDIKGPQGAFVVGQRWVNTASNLSFTLTSFSPSSGTISATWTQEGGSGSGSVTSVTGTTNQVSVSPTTGATVVSLPSAITTPGSLTTTTSLASGTTITAGTGITATTGNIVATTGNISTTAGSISSATTVTAGTGITATTGNITATAGQLVAGGDAAGVASTVSLTNTNSTTVSSGTGTIKMTTANNANSSAWIKIYIGTTAYYVPAFTTDAP